tara:strand:- start:55 stop:267 length:213 start_codon:yes stop_codon:yes gene_type:complete
MSKKSDIAKTVFEFYYNQIYHMQEDLGYALGDTLHDEFTETELTSITDEEIMDIHSSIVKKLDELKALYP